MAKYRIKQAAHIDDKYYILEKKRWFGWEYVTLNKDKKELESLIEFIRTDPEIYKV